MPSDKFKKYASGPSKLEKYKKSMGSTLSQAEKETEQTLKEKTAVAIKAKKGGGNATIIILAIANAIVWISAILNLLR